MTNDEEWCRQNPGRAAALIAQKDLGWSQCSHACARLQGEARSYQRALGEEYAKREALEAELAEERQAYDDLRDVLERVKQERSALAAHVAVLESIINGSSLTDSPYVMPALNSAPATSLASLKAQWVEEMLRTLPYKELHTNNGDLREDARYRDGWNTFRDYLRRQAEEADDDNE